VSGYISRCLLFVVGIVILIIVFEDAAIESMNISSEDQNDEADI
jgi:hypothetical protein